MTTATNTTGVMFRCKLPPELLRDYAIRAEQAGYDELWVVEDCFFGGGVSTAASVLAYTESITVGLGIMPAVARNAAFAAMEIATLARLYPGRFLPGFGHGVADWMKQIGAFPASQLAAIEEVTRTVRSLLHGEAVTRHGRHVHMDDVKLEFPPEVVPPLSLGVQGPKSLAIAGRAADGTILPEGSAPAFVRWARGQIAQGADSAGRTAPHRVTVFTFASVRADGDQARADVRPIIANMLPYPDVQRKIAPTGLLPEINARLAADGAAGLAAGMPDEWLRQLTVSGTPDECAAAIHALRDAGADAVVLVPAVEEPAMMAALAREVLPLVR
jgi:5,10-methylenetetrahydromethanopterin reductase